MSKTIAAFGEVLWDLLPDGRTLGGAPFNFINRVSELGHKGNIVSALGEDEIGNEALEAVNNLGLKTEFIQHIADRPTGTVKVFFNDLKQPDYEIIKEVAYDYITFTPELEALAKSVDCIYFGTLAQRSERSRQTLQELLNCGNGHQRPYKYLDINLRKNCYTLELITSSLKRTDILKLNEDEAHEIASLLNLKGKGLEDIARELVLEYGLIHCIITLGERGAICVSEDESSVYDPGYKVNVIDPCGSGDAFSAGFIHQFFEDQPAIEGIRLGNILGAVVASQRGATSPVTNEGMTHISEGVTDRLYHPEFIKFVSKDKHHTS